MDAKKTNDALEIARKYRAKTQKKRSVSFWKAIFKAPRRLYLIPSQAYETV